jgi:hypothetical protein
VIRIVEVPLAVTWHVAPEVVPQEDISSGYPSLDRKTDWAVNEALLMDITDESGNE